MKRLYRRVYEYTWRYAISRTRYHHAYWYARRYNRNGLKVLSSCIWKYTQIKKEFNMFKNEYKGYESFPFYKFTNIL